MVATLQNFDWNNRPLLGTTATTNPVAVGQTVPGQQIFLGGFSGLFFEGTAANGNLIFVTHPDRGPNGEPTDLLRDVAGSERPFALPGFQPEIVRFQLNSNTGAITISDRLGLSRQNGSRLTGLPNLQAGASGSAFTDEVGIDLFGNRLNNDPLGADLEGIVRASDNTYWLVDEYRPAIYHFSNTGTLIDRFVPSGTAAAVNQPLGTFGTEAIPAVYGARRANRGFEAVALEGDRLYAFIQSPIDNPDTTADTTSRNSRNLRILEFNTRTNTVTGEYLYVLDSVTAPGNARTDKIGDAVSLGGGKFLVIERDDLDNQQSNKLIYQVDLSQATNINNPANLARVPAGRTLEQLSFSELGAAGIQPVNKLFIVNPSEIGYVGADKLEGLALVNSTTLAIINDNDFGLAPAPIPGNGTVPLDTDPTPVRLGLIRLDQPVPTPTNTISGTGQADLIRARGGNNSILGGDGNDTIFGNQGNDSILGQAGSDRLNGGIDNDTLSGGEGDDTLFGDLGNDQVSSDAGNDLLTGVSTTATTFGLGEIDTLTGGLGSDRFILGDSTRAYYNAAVTTTANPGLSDYALVSDFESADQIQLFRGASYLVGNALNGVGVFIDDDGVSGLSGNDELIAVFTGVSDFNSLSARFVLV
ncbi:MAG: esterase-like activity of phytase family protein [Pseudanabaenaceae cyanobacterium bins.68]|nr:esterase-like activity of phytase family protein [Pseudanabaenaceae cyanobacterium bins.68]